MTRIRRTIATGAIGLAVCWGSAGTAAQLLYYNDGGGTVVSAPGVVAGPVLTFGTTLTDTAYEDDPFLSAILPAVSNPNRGWIFHTDKSSGDKGGGIYLRFDLRGVPGGVKRGAITGGAAGPADADGKNAPLTYATYGLGRTPGARWKANFAFADGEDNPGRALDQRFVELVKDHLQGPVRDVKVAYEGTISVGGDIFAAPPQQDPAPNNVQSAYSGGDGITFFEVVGGTLDYLDFFIGDFDQRIDFQRLSHFLSAIHLFGDAGPTDFGYDPAQAQVFQFMRTGNEAADGSFTVTAGIAYVDEVPLPPMLPAFVLGLAGLGVLARRRTGRR